MAKILIVGAGGYIGSIASYLFLQKGHEIVAIDNCIRLTNLYSGRIEVLNSWEASNDAFAHCNAQNVREALENAVLLLLGLLIAETHAGNSLH